MRFCQEHWDALRAAVDQRGMSHLVAADGETAAMQVADQFKRAAEGGTTTTPANFDPLMHAHWAIINNAMETVARAGGSPLYLMAGPDVPEDPVRGYGPEHEGRTWPRCPLCYVNLAHEVLCSGCELDQERGFDFWIDRAADDAKAKSKEVLES